MTDDLPQLVQRLRDLRDDLALDHRRQDAADVADAATALDSLTRTLAERTQERDAEKAGRWLAETDLSQASQRLMLLTREYQESSDLREAALIEAQDALTAAVREARAETWEAAAAFHAAMAVSSVMVSLRPVHEVYATEFRQRATASRAADPTGEK